MVKRGALDSVNEKYVKWLTDLSKDDTPTVGGKGANLAEMYNAGLPVPPAFCVSAQAFDYFLKNAGIKQKIAEIISKTNVQDTKELDVNSQRIRDLIIDANIPAEMEKEKGVI